MGRIKECGATWSRGPKQINTREDFLAHVAGLKNVFKASFRGIAITQTEVLKERLKQHNKKRGHKICQSRG